MSPSRDRLACDQPQTRNAKMFYPNAGNQQEFKILGDFDESSQIKRLISFHMIYNRYTILDWEPREELAIG